MNTSSLQELLSSVSHKNALNTTSIEVQDHIIGQQNDQIMDLMRRAAVAEIESIPKEKDFASDIRLENSQKNLAMSESYLSKVLDELECSKQLVRAISDKKALLEAEKVDVKEALKTSQVKNADLVKAVKQLRLTGAEKPLQPSESLETPSPVESEHAKVIMLNKELTILMGRLNKAHGKQSASVKKIKRLEKKLGEFEQGNIKIKSDPLLYKNLSGLSFTIDTNKIDSGQVRTAYGYRRTGEVAGVVTFEPIFEQASVIAKILNLQSKSEYKDSEIVEMIHKEIGSLEVSEFVIISILNGRLSDKKFSAVCGVKLTGDLLNKMKQALADEYRQVSFYYKNQAILSNSAILSK